ncbi:hypothetical protein AB4027_11125 [Alkalibacterium putridalgicola]|uniref:hypothetical protein n=1 Tax=Alkalibacterium putridalgicola TaxID=426703 RepID=UPI0034CDF71B
MDNFDEYQKLMRYKYGYHSFFIIVALSIINFNLELFYDIQWAETKSLEFMLFIFLAAGYSIVMNVYKGAYFTKKQNSNMYAVIFLFIGIANFYLSISPYSPLIIDGLLTSNIIKLVNGLIWTSLPVAYFTRQLVDKKRNENDSD